MIIKDIIEGYFVLRDLKKRGYVEEDGLGFAEFVKLVCNAERNVKKRVEVKDEDKQS